MPCPRKRSGSMSPTKESHKAATQGCEVKQGRKESLRSYAPVQKNHNREPPQASDFVQVEEEERKDGKKLKRSAQNEMKSTNDSGRAEAVGKLVEGLQELSDCLVELDWVFQKCKELSAIVGGAATSRVESEEEGGTDIKMTSPYREILEVVMGDAENEAKTSSNSSGADCDDEVTEIYADADGAENEIDATFRADWLLWHDQSSDPYNVHGREKEDPPSHRLAQDSVVPTPQVISQLGEEPDETEMRELGISSTRSSDLNIIYGGEEEDPLLNNLLSVNGVPTLQVVSQLGDEEPDASKIKEVGILSTRIEKAGEVENGSMDSNSEERQSYLEQHLDATQLPLQILGNDTSAVDKIAAGLIMCKPLAAMQRYGPWSTRIRKDGKKWRRRIFRFTHIKRKYLLYTRRREAPFGEVVTMQNLLMKGRRNEETGFPADFQEDENSPYQAYRRSAQMDTDASKELDEQEIEDLFHEMDIAIDRGWEKGETKDNQTNLQNKGCSHDYVFLDDVGYVCEKCGLVAQDIQSIFVLQDATSLKKKAAVVPVEEQVNFESQDDNGLSIQQELLCRPTLALHPFYEENLHPHQKEGIMFLTQNLLGDAQRRLAPGGCILAHAPGTGKSCLTVSFVQSFLNAYPKGRPLIVAPKIMLKPWQQQFEQWNVEDIPTYNLNETFKKSKKKSWKGRCDLASAVSASPHFKERLEGGRLKLIKKWLDKRSVLLVSYNLFAILVLAGFNDEKTGSVKQQICEALLDGPELLILDEGHFPRTKSTKISQALMRVRTNRKILLSGTLFQNNFKELFNLLKLARDNFMHLSPDFSTRLKSTNRKQPSLDEDNHFAGRTFNELNFVGREREEQMFMEHIGYKPEDFVEGAENFEEINVVLRKLRAITSPIVHWYAGKILDSLPGLFEYVVYLNLSAHQQTMLSHLRCKSSFEEKTRIAEVCIHPALLKCEENFERAVFGRNTTHHAHEDPYNGVKTAFIFNLLRLCYVSGERLLIFCQTLSPLALIESMLTKRLGWSRGKEILRLDGTMQSDERQSMIQQFNDGSSKACVMLASITACKEGISLVGASRVVILDVLYNPSVVRQAVSRAFRIGQKKRVYVYRLIAADTKEEMIFQAAVQKDWLSRVLVNQSWRMSGNRYHAEKILQVDGASEDQILKKMLQTDDSRRVNRVCRYNSNFSK